MWGRGFYPGCHRPRARVPLVVWAWDFLFCGFLAAVSSPLLSRCFSLFNTFFSLFNTPFLLWFLRAYLAWLDCMIPGLYEVIQYTLSL